MKSVYQNIRNIVRPLSFYIPFTFYFLLFGISGLLAYYWLHARQLIPDTSFADIFKLLLQVLFWFALCAIAFALITVAVSYIYFVWAKRKNKLHCSISNIANANGIQPKIQINISPLLKPLLGFVKLRLQYGDKIYSHKLLAADVRQKEFFSATYKGIFTWHLPEIKEYQVQKVVVYFEDIFQFFSLTAAMPVQTNFYRQPFTEKVKDFSVSPMKTQETATRIEELKKVEGEYLSYKNFEDNDDVRRIVWKIYAKNKELVVRIPEVLDPYASHACVYASFHNSFNIAGNSAAEIFFLNYYKSVVWSIYKKLCSQNLEVKFMQDQTTPAKYFTEQQLQVQYNISTSNWQTEKDLRTFVNLKDAAVIIVSSLCTAEDVQTILENKSSALVIFVPLSRSLKRSYLINMIQWLFVQQEKNELEKYKAAWRLSLLRSKITENEKALKALMDKHSGTMVI